ncbi:MAG: hypothetical protein HYX92_18175 [Chloroflexi bacterium]|nr:hypothetical protein [Chloroflexota bacterium]
MTLSLEETGFLEYEEFSDGLPVVAPTRARVEAALAYVDRRPDEIVAKIPPSWAQATVESIAVNAVMAGCRPEYLPAVIAAVDAISEPQFNLYGVQATTHPVAPLLIFSGPLAREMGINGGAGAFGPGYRANATIGRAIRLILLNTGGARPGELDKATLGHPGKYTYCIAENEEASPWKPLRVELGFQPEDSIVMAFPAEGPHNINDHFGATAKGILIQVAGAMAGIGANDWYYDECRPLLILSPEHAATVAQDGFSKADIKRYLFETVKVPLSTYSPENIVGRFRDHWPERYADAPEDTMLPLLRAPENLTVIVAGGPGKHSMYVPTAGNFLAVAKLIALKDGSAIHSLKPLSRPRHTDPELNSGDRRGSETLDPRGVPAGVARKAVAPAPSTLDGKVIGLLDNTKANARFLLSCIGGELAGGFRIKGSRAMRKPEVAKVVPREQTDILRQCDVVITGSGD